MQKKFPNVAPRKQTWLVYKPYLCLCQFSKDQPEQICLKDLPFAFPSDAYPIGRLDADSEGLLLISNDKKLVDALLNPNNKKPKTYLAQVEGAATDEQLQPLTEGVSITVDKKPYQTLPASWELMPDQSELLPPRNPPIRYRANIPTSWVKIQIVEGKNRQVRKMLAAVGLPVLRLVRVGMDNYDYFAHNLQSGQVVEIV